MSDWQYNTAEDLDQTMAERLQHFPREPDMLVYGLRLLAAAVIRSWLKVYHRLTILGRENLPSEGSYVLVANHSSHLDALSMLSALPVPKIHRAFPAAAKDYFFVSVPRSSLSAILVNALPFDREVHIRQSLCLCRHLLKNPGNILILFPEGTRSSDGTLGPFKPGVGALLAGTEWPVLPCGLDGAHKAWPKGRLVPRPRRVTLRIGSPRNYGALPRGKDTSKRICDELHAAIQDLTMNTETTHHTTNQEGDTT